MTTAPSNLLAVRKLLLAHLDVDPGKARSIDLESAEVGIVGDTAHVSQGNSYHLGLPEQSRTGYAATESPRDTKGLCGYASALDVGMFTVTTPKGVYDLRHFSAWCVGQCKAGAADAKDIREIIWSPDGKVVRRWDDLGKRSTGDSSHLYHTHFSFYRDATKAGRDLTPLFTRYLTSIGLTASGGVNDLFCNKGDSGLNVTYLQYRLKNLGYDPGAVDGVYGDATAAALQKAMVAAGSTLDGNSYGPAHMIYLDAAWSRKFGNQGPAGPQGPQGVPGVTLPQILSELARRLAG